MENLLRDAYRERAAGDEVGAKRLFDDMMALARPWAVATPGTGKSGLSIAVPRGGVAAGDRHGVLFFKADTGEPFAYEPGLYFESDEGPLPTVPLFSVDGGLYDPIFGTLVVEGATVLVHPSGQTAYALGHDCRWHEWDLVRRTESALLPATPMPPWYCSSTFPRSSFITSDGRWLVALGGYWDLPRRRLIPFSRDRMLGPAFPPAESPDGRYVAYIGTAVPPMESGDSGPGFGDLVLFDRQRGTDVAVRETSFGTLSNGRPLSFSLSGRYLLVTDYARWLYAVPGLRLVEKSSYSRLAGHSAEAARALSEGFVEPESVRSTPALAALKSRLDARVCSVGGLLVPRSLCEK